MDAERQIVLYGQSIGSAPTLYVASRRRVAATVLHTPLLSGLRFLIPPSTGCCSVGGCCSPVCVYALCDPFPNLKRIRRVTAPVLLIHGTADRTVDCSHSFMLYDRLPAQYRRDPYIINGAGHENVVDYDIEGYFGRMHAFLASVSMQGSGAAAADAGDMAPPTAALCSRVTPHSEPTRAVAMATQPISPACDPSPEPVACQPPTVDFSSVQAECDSSSPRLGGGHVDASLSCESSWTMPAAGYRG